MNGDTFDRYGSTGVGRWLVPVVLGLIVITGVGLRLWRITDESPWWDEIVTLEVLDAPNVVDFVQAERRTDPPMTPAYYVLAYCWSRITSPSVLAMRLLSVVLGMAAVPLTFLLTRRMFGPVAGLAAAALHTFSMVQVYYSQEIRVYALVTLLSLLSAYALFRALDERGAAWWGVHVAANAILMFTHLFALLFIAAEACYLLWVLRGRLSMLIKWVGVHAILFILLLLWLSTVDTATLHNAAKWMVEPSIRELVMVFLVFAGGRASNENPAPHLPTGVSLDLVYAAVLMAVIVWFVFSRRKTGRGAWPVLFLMCWLCVPIAVLWAASFLWRPCFVYRYILFSALPLYMLGGAAFSAVNGRAVKSALAALVLAMLAHQWSALAVGPFRPDWRAAGTYLEAHAAPADRIVVFQDLNLIALKFNSHLSPERLRLAPVWSDIAGAVQEARAAGVDTWVVLWLWSDPANIENGFRAAGAPFSHVDFEGWPRARVYHVETAQTGGSGQPVLQGNT